MARGIERQSEHYAFVDPAVERTAQHYEAAAEVDGSEIAAAMKPSIASAARSKR